MRATPQQLEPRRLFAFGDVVRSFGAGGSATIHFGSADDAQNVADIEALNGGGFLIAGGSTNFGIAKYLSNGTLDSAFGDSGHINLAYFPRDVQLLPNGDFAIVGEAP